MPQIVLPPNASSDLRVIIDRLNKLESQPLGNPRGALVPGSIATLTLTSAPERDPKTGNDVATVTATWTAPTDTQPVAYYNVRFSYDGGTTWSGIDQVYGLTTIIHNLLLNKSVTVGVRAVTPAGKQGPETTNTITTSFDVTAPNTPSTPTGSAGALQFTVAWDGKDSGGVALLTNAPDLASIQVHASQTTGFTPSSATLFGNITALSGGNYTSLVTASGIWYVKFVAVDKTGNASAGSVQFQVTVLPAAVTSTAVGTLRNTDASMFQTPTTPGGFLPQGLTSIVADTAAFDGTSVSTGTTAATNWVAVSNYSGLKPGQYQATAYVKIAAGAGSASTQICTLNLANTTNISCNAQTITGAAFSSNGTYYGITMPVFVTGACTAQVVVAQPASTTATFNVSHITIDTASDVPAEFIRSLAVVDAKIANMSADKIIAGTITATVGVGTLGILRAGTAGAARVNVTSAGINAYNGSNVVKFTVDSSTGNVTVIGGTITGGIIQTATSGARVVIDATTNAERTKFYTGNVNESAPGYVGSLVVNSGLANVSLDTVVQSPTVSGNATEVAEIVVTSGNNDGSHVRQFAGNTAYRIASTDTAVTFLNGTSNFGSGHQTCRYYRDGAGVVHLMGLLNNNSGATITAGSAVCSFSGTGFLPTATVLFGQQASSGLWRLDVTSAGNVTTFVAMPTGTWVTLSGISFYTMDA